MMMTGSAQQRSQVGTGAVQAVVQAGVAQPSEFDSRTEQVSRSSARTALAPAKVQQLAAQRAVGLSKADAAAAKVAQQRAAKVQAAKLAAAARAKAAQLKAQRARAAAAARSSLPMAGGFTIAARFGDVGSWSRYHTGMDFSAAVGTPILAPTSGVVTNAGSGSASGWAGNYVTIRHADGNTSLFAHMSDVTVSVGQRVTAGQKVGSVGMTGRTFGPHMHFEIYPAGVTPGDVYRAVNPEPWLGKLGVRV
jgi:murein DD-endopeptidase MepM/ murein hydrolase activator NlpD